MNLAMNQNYISCRTMLSWHRHRILSACHPPCQWWHSWCHSWWHWWQWSQWEARMWPSRRCSGVTRTLSTYTVPPGPGSTSSGDMWQPIRSRIFMREPIRRLAINNESSCLKSPLTSVSLLSSFRANYGRFSLSICNSEALGTLRTSCDSSQSTSNILRTRYLLGYCKESSQLR